MWIDAFLIGMNEGWQLWWSFPEWVKVLTCIPYVVATIYLYKKNPDGWMAYIWDCKFIKRTK